MTDLPVRRQGGGMGDIKTWGMILKWGVDTPLRLCRGGKSNTVAACSFSRRIAAEVVVTKGYQRMEFEEEFMVMMSQEQGTKGKY